MKPLPDRLRHYGSAAYPRSKGTVTVDAEEFRSMQLDMRRAAERIDNVEEAGMCRTCKANVSAMGGECRTCANYRKRTGFPRPRHLTERQPDLNWRRAGKSA